MLSQNCDIKIAFLGYVSVGKTTLLNALLQDKFSEVSMRRTTMGINFFRISSLSSNDCRDDASYGADGNKKLKAKSKKVRQKDDDSSIEKESTTSSNGSYILMSAKETLKKIVDNNSRLREKNSIEEKFFEIELEKPLLNMRRNTDLVLVDIPGVNEAGSSKLYLDYVEKSWDGFDCVIVVMDAIQGVNTEEQVKLLEFVNTNLKKKKKMPVIVICNKVDDPEDQEVMNLVDEARKKVDQIYEGVNSKKTAFMHLSAENAFLYRSASRLKLEEFKKLDKSYINKIGHEEVGRFKWKKLSMQQKYELVHKIVSDPSQYQERLAASNFDTFLKVFDYFVGGEKNQEDLIEKKLEVTLAKLTMKDEFAEKLSEVYDQLSALKKPAGHLKHKFWSLYSECQKDAFAQLYQNPMEITSMHKPMEELVRYVDGLHKKLFSINVSNLFATREKDEKQIISSMKDLIKQQCGVVVEKESVWTFGTSDDVHANSCYWDNYNYNYNGHWQNQATGATSNNPKNLHPAGDLPEHWYWNGNKWQNSHTGETKEGKQDENPGSKPLTNWHDMSPRDWSTIITSILLTAHNKFFYENFGMQIADLEWLTRTGKFTDLNFCPNCNTSTCSCRKPGREYQEYMKGTYESGVFTPTNLANYRRAVQINVPDSLADPSHWGHLTWMFCEFMELHKSNSTKSKSFDELN